MSLWGAITGAVGGFITGGPGGAVVGAITGYQAGNSTPPAPRPQAPITGGGNIGVSVPGLGGFNFGGGVSIGSGYGAAGGAVAATGGGCPKGYHLNKHSLAPSKSHGAVPARSICVRNRHMNPLNYRADSRALRRLKRANKLTRKIHNLFHHPRRVAAVGKKR